MSSILAILLGLVIIIAGLFFIWFVGWLACKPLEYTDDVDTGMRLSLGALTLGYIGAVQ